jgi:hypothetical protein
VVSAGGATGPLDTPQWHGVGRAVLALAALWGLAAFAAGSQARRVIP